MDAEDVARWLEQGRHLLGQLRELVESVAQDHEGLLGRVHELEEVMARLSRDNNRLRSERDELLAAFNRLAHLVEEVRLSRGGGVAE